ncbi:hypothetical protein AB833_04820 [Chromatiales bacterium (ex Bugula neritina AB1)]|nr:hypothetical protein AB833_04820 [Chromatiales bacterium (ex Bugula neritina AB1)]
MLITVSTQSTADDTEVFFPKVRSNPNFLFLIDVSGSMGWYDNGATGTRLQRIKDAMNELLSNASGINVGLMKYGGNTTEIVESIASIDDNRSEMIARTNALVAGGGTPTVNSLYEAGLYLRGEAPRFGCKGSNATHPACGATYVSPLNKQCQANHIVVLTDGSPNTNSSVGRIQKRLGYNCTIANVDGSINGGTCAAEFANYLYNQDNSTSVPGHNRIVTHTIGFNFSDPWLGTIAEAGMGTNSEAESASDLLTVLESIMTVSGEDHTFAAPAATVDRFSRISHREDIYFGLFQPTNKARWSGNLKKYLFSGSPPKILDSNNSDALDENNNFVENAKSFWSATEDGAKVAEGGAASILNADRKVYTYTGGDSKDLTSWQHALYEYNPLITADMLDVPAAEVVNLLKWARGVDVDDENGNSSTTDIRLHMGDPLHSQPTILTYGGTENSPDSVVFIATNEGFLHAIDSATGQEVYSFIPRELLPNLDFFYDNNHTTNRPYGLDGDITLWVDDKNNNGNLDSASEKAYLYVGMRRGGNNYYALDVTTKDSPKFLWSIKGDSGDFSQLGQSWSKPTKAKIHINNTATDVLIFGGGYDPMQDFATIRSEDTIGNSIYIVNAKTGDLIWNAEKSTYGEMKYSIPSDPRVIDIDGDGFVDQIYIGDMGGQIWRFDIEKSATANSSVIKSGGVLANLAGDSTADNRRFFYPPDISLIADGTSVFMSLAIGSGNRANPLGEQINDRFYMIKQNSIYSAPEGYGIAVEKEDGNNTSEEVTYRAIEESDLFDTTDNTIGSSDPDIAEQAALSLASKKGWLYRFETAGEKVLAHSITLDNKIFFSTYLPDTEHTDVCTPALGSGRAYSVSIYNNQPFGESRWTELTRPAIPPPPAAIFSADGTITVMVGPESIAVPHVNLTQRVYWSEHPDF